jgi:thymidylate synthase (FAD)
MTKPNKLEDPFFKILPISLSPEPQRVVYTALHQDYSSHMVMERPEDIPDEKTAGELSIKYLLKGDRGHYGPFEHPQICLNFGYFPHSTMQQVRTHRNVSFDVQSFRYTSESLIELADLISAEEKKNGKGFILGGEAKDLTDSIEKLVYLRPEGIYTDRKGGRYKVTLDERLEDLNHIADALSHYRKRINRGYSEEHSRGTLPFDVRQHWVMSGNARAVMHLLDLRGKMDVQLETRVMCDRLMDLFEEWMPEIGAWYKETRYRKGAFAP